jgi:hypothetical protein
MLKGLNVFRRSYMKVYIVYRELDEAASVIAVYSSAEAAQKFVETLDKLHSGSSYYWDEELVQD